jgi:hypothetical protein
MFDAAALAADEILSIPEDQPERLFGSPEEVASRYRALAMWWHPDHASLRGTKTAEVFQRIAKLHSKAREKLADGFWRTPGWIEFHASNGTLHRMSNVREFDCGIGEGYLGLDLVAYALKREFADLIGSALRLTANLSYQSEEMRGMMSLRLPHQRENFEIGDRTVLVVDKPVAMVRLRDLHEYLGKQMDTRHVAWILSELLNIACYLDWAGLVHGDISLDNIFVDPRKHTASVLGGWWYAMPAESRLTALPSRTVAVMSRDALENKRATPRITLNGIRLLGQELLGASTAVPNAFSTWLRLPPPDSALQDYSDWQTILADSFGPRRFAELSVSTSDIYKEGR